MLDNLRDSASSSFFDDDEDLPDFMEEEEVVAPSATPKKRKPRKPFLGLTPIQGFVLSVMLFFTVCMLGTLVLLVFGRVMIPAF